MILDAGCGRRSKPRLQGTIGLDIKPSVRPDVVGTIERLPFKSHVFQTVIASHVLEHVYRDLEALREFHRVLVPGGKLLLSTPNEQAYDRLWRTLRRKPASGSRGGHVRDGYCACVLERWLLDCGFKPRRRSFAFSRHIVEEAIAI
ncbi:MAG: class I SAM-dependent methyltransferase [Deltaproteobacteria bacterium]|nr:class I SAM-dependent methyltransferase [Deltaproteobacteria bacterium]